MDLGKVIFSFMGVLIIGFCLVSAVQMITPLNQKIALDQTCRDYMYSVNVSQGLSQAEKIELISELKKIGLDQPVITCPGQGELGRKEQGVFKVTGIIQVRTPEGFLSFSEKELSYEFKGKVFGKVIIN